MSFWVNVPASGALLTEVNAVGDPDRQRAQDGTVGDLAHIEGGTSDHLPDEDTTALKARDSDSVNEVHARDVDSRGLWLPGWSMERIVQIILARCRAGAEKRIRYVIYRKRIWRASATVPWTQETYTGDDPHELHAHFSFNYGSGASTSNPENITSPWGILAAYEAEQDMALDQTDVATIVKGFRNTGGSGILSDTERSYIGKAVSAELAPVFTMLLAAIAKVDVIDSADVASIVAGILAGLPAELAHQIASIALDEAAARLAS